MPPSARGAEPSGSLSKAVSLRCHIINRLNAVVLHSLGGCVFLSKLRPQNPLRTEAVSSSWKGVWVRWWAGLNCPGQREQRRAQALPCCEIGGCSQGVLGDMWHHGACHGGASRSPKSHKGGCRCLHWCNLIQRIFSVVLSLLHRSRGHPQVPAA